MMNGLVFLNVVAHAAPNGKEFSNNAKFGAQKEHCLICFQMQLFKPIALSRNSSLKIKKKPHVLLTFDKVHNPWRLPRETTSERPKVARTCGVFNILTSKCASRHNGVHFFDTATSKSIPKLR